MRPISSGGAARWASWSAMVGDRMPSAVSRQTTPASTCRMERTAATMRPLRRTAHCLRRGSDTQPPACLLDQCRLAALEEAVGDDQALDLAGALPAAVDAQLAVEALGDVLAHVAAAAEDLHRPIGDPARHLGGIELRHGALGVARLAVGPGVDLFRRAVGHEAGGPELRQAVGQHDLDCLALRDGLAEGDAAPGERRGLVDQALGGAAAACGDAEPLIPEPVMGELHPPAFRADAIAGRNPDILEAVDGMVGGIAVAVGRRAQQPDAGRVHVDEEQAMRPRMRAALELGLEDEVIRVIGAGDMPFLAVEYIDLTLAAGGGLDRVHIGSGAGLADRIAFVALPADVGPDPGLHLIVRGGAGLDHPGRGGIVAPAERIGDLADLLLDDDLLQGAEARAAELLGNAQRPQADLAGAAAVACSHLGRQLPAVH